MFWVTNPLAFLKLTNPFASSKPTSNSPLYVGKEKVTSQIEIKDRVIRFTLPFWKRIFGTWAKIAVKQDGQIKHVYLDVQKFLKKNKACYEAALKEIPGVDQNKYKNFATASQAFTIACANKASPASITAAAFDFLEAVKQVLSAAEEGTEIKKIKAENETEVAKLFDVGAVVIPEAPQLVLPEQEWWSAGQGYVAPKIRTVTLPDGSTFTGSGIQIENEKSRVESEIRRKQDKEKIAQEQLEARQKIENERLEKEAAFEKEQLEKEAAAEKARAKQADIDDINRRFRAAVEQADPSALAKVDAVTASIPSAIKASDKPVAVVLSGSDTPSCQITPAVATKPAAQQEDETETFRVRKIGGAKRAPKPVSVEQNVGSQAQLLGALVVSMVESAPKPVPAAINAAPAQSEAPESLPQIVPAVRENPFITQDVHATKVLTDKKAAESKKDHSGAYWYYGQTPEPNESYSLKPGGKNPPSKVRPGERIGKYW